MNDEWWMVNDEWWMMNDEWWMMNGEWRMINDEWWMMNGEWWIMNDEWWMVSGEWWWMVNGEWWMMNDEWWCIHIHAHAHIHAHTYPTKMFNPLDLVVPIINKTLIKERHVLTSPDHQISIPYYIFPHYHVTIHYPCWYWKITNTIQFIMDEHTVLGKHDWSIVWR